MKRWFRRSIDNLWEYDEATGMAQWVDAQTGRVSSPSSNTLAQALHYYHVEVFPDWSVPELQLPEGL